MNRKDLQELSNLRIKEAKILLDNGYYDGAYYLSGYSVECALKACIAKNTKTYDFPDKKVVNASHIHDLSSLIKTAGLELYLQNQLKNKQFQLYWNVIISWKETSRYQKNSKIHAKDIYKAITARKYGFSIWIKKHW